jgi:hypothetical protein
MDTKQENINTVFSRRTLWISLGIFASSTTYSHPDTHALERELQKKELPEKITTGTFSASKSWLIKYLREERKADNRKNYISRDSFLGTKSSKHKKNQAFHKIKTKVSHPKKAQVLHVQSEKQCRKK